MTEPDPAALSRVTFRLTLADFRHPLKQLGTIIPKQAFTDPDVKARFRWLAHHLGKSSQPPSRTPLGGFPNTK